MFTLRRNPFERVEHNQWRLPRIAFHGAHAAIGLPAWLLGLWLGWPVALVAGVGLACLDKCVWFNWRGGRVVWTGFDVIAPHDWADFASDLGLTLLGALLPPVIVALPCYYVLSLVNGT